MSLHTVTPWIVQPSLIKLTGFVLKMVSPDLLHVWHLGVGRDLIASVLMDLMHAGFFGRRGRFEAAQSSLQEFCSKNGLALKTILSRETLGLKSGEFPELHCKGNQTTVIHKWLCHLAEDGRDGLAHVGGQAVSGWSYCMRAWAQQL